MAETNIPQSMDVAGECSLYYESMISAYLADVLREERPALRPVLMDRNIEVVGEAAGWTTVSAQAPMSCTGMLLVVGIYSPTRLLQPQQKSERFARPRWSLPSSAIWTPVSKAALTANADAFISKGASPEPAAERLRAVATEVHT